MTTSLEIRAAPEALPPSLSCDVAIVGCGPVGMTTAALLAQQGLDVLIVEKHASRYHLARAGHFDGEIMRLFQQIGIAGRLEFKAQAVTDYSMLDAEMNVLMEIAPGESGQGWKTSYLCPSTQLEELLSERLDELGVRVFMGVKAEGVEERGDRVMLTTHRTDDHSKANPTVVNARYVIGADGANSNVRNFIGAKRQDLGFKPWEHLIVDFEQADPDKEYSRLTGFYQLLDYKRPMHVGRWGGNRWTRMECARLNDEPREHLESDEMVWELLSKWGITPADGKIVRKAFYTFEASLTDKWREGRVLLVGDAAHTMPPYLGQGMCNGLRDAANLSWKLAAVISGRADARLLDSYEVERKEHVQTFIKMSIHVGDFSLVTNEEEARQRDEMLRSGSAPGLPPFPRLLSGIVQGPQDDTAEVAGRPGPQARVSRRNRIALLDDFLQPGWRLVSRHAFSPDTLSAEQRQLVSLLDMDFVHISRGVQPDSYPDSFRDTDGEYSKWYAHSERKAFLQRPDRYVFGTAKEMEDIPSLLDTLGQVLASNGWNGLSD